MNSETLAILAAVPRSYWKSTQRSPTQKGILNDYLQILQYTLTRFPKARIIIYGHSLGASVAVCLLSQLHQEAVHARGSLHCDARFANIKGLVLENPFSSIPGMAKALYPERWTPYHYMGPLTWDKWDAISAMRGAKEGGSILGRLTKDMMVVVSENDELVPKEMGQELWEAAGNATGAVADECHEQGRRGVGCKVVIRDALHENAWKRRQWLREMTRYLADVGRKS